MDWKSESVDRSAVGTEGPEQDGTPRKRRTARTELICALILGFATSASAQPREPVPLTRDQVVALALQNDPSSAALEQRAEALSSERTATMVGLFPDLGVSGSAARIGGFDEGQLPMPEGPVTIEVPRNRTTVRAEIVYPVSDALLRTRPAVEAVDHALDGNDALLEDRQLSRTLQAELAFLDYAEAEAEREVSQNALARAGEQHARIEALHRAGSATSAAVAAARARRAEAQLAVIAAEQRLRVRTTELSVLMDEPVPSRGWRAILPESDSLSGSPTEHLRQALANRADLAAVDASIRSEEGTSRAERAGILPSVSIYGGYVLANPNPNAFPQTQRWDDSWEVGVRASWSLAGVVRSLGRASAAEARASELGANRTALEQQIRREVDRANARWVSAVASEEAAGVAVEAAREAYEASASKLRVGQLVWVELQEADLRLARAELELKRAEIAGLRAAAALRRAIGGQR